MFKVTLTNLAVLVLLFGIGQIDQCDQCDDTRMGPAGMTVGMAATGDALPRP